MKPAARHHQHDAEYQYVYGERRPDINMIRLGTARSDERNADLKQFLDAFYLAPVGHEQDHVIV